MLDWELGRKMVIKTRHLKANKFLLLETAEKELLPRQELFEKSEIRFRQRGVCCCSKTEAVLPETVCFLEEQTSKVSMQEVGACVSE